MHRRKNKTFEWSAPLKAATFTVGIITLMLVMVSPGMARTTQSVQASNVGAGASPTDTPTDMPTLTDTVVPTPPATATATAATATVCPMQFSDVPAGSTFYPYIRCLACRLIVNGYSDGTFRLNSNVTRGQLSKIVSNSAG